MNVKELIVADSEIIDPLSLEPDLVSVEDLAIASSFVSGILQDAVDKIVIGLELLNIARSLLSSMFSVLHLALLLGLVVVLRHFIDFVLALLLVLAFRLSISDQMDHFFELLAGVE